MQRHPSLLIATLLLAACSAAQAQTPQAKDKAAQTQLSGATVLAPVTVEQPRVRRDATFSPFVWDTIGATGTIRTDIVRRWFASEQPEPVRTAGAAPAQR